MTDLISRAAVVDTVKQWNGTHLRPVIDMAREIVAAVEALPAETTPSRPVTAGREWRWHLASMNDGLFIINAPPRPSTDHVRHDQPDGPSIVLNVTELSEAKATAIVDVMNGLSLPPQDGGAVEAFTPTEFVDDILSACDASNWDADRNTGDYYRGLKDAYEHIMDIAIEYQTAMYGATKRLAATLPRAECAGK